MITNYLKIATQKASLLIFGLCFSLLSFGQEVEWVLKPTMEFEFVRPFKEGLAGMQKNGEWGFVDKTGSIIIPFQYDQTFSSFSEGLVNVRKDSKYGFIDKTGQVIIPFEYDYASEFSEGLAFLKKGLHRNFIDKTGKVVIKQEYEHDFNDGKRRNFSEGLATVGKDGKYGFIDKTGKIVIPFKYDKVFSFSEGLARVANRGKYGYIDKNGKIIIPFEYDWYSEDFSEGLACVHKNGKYGFIDKTGKIVIPFTYIVANSFSEGLAAVLIKDNLNNEKIGYIDKTGKLIIPFEYDSMSNFSDGLACVEKNDKVGFIDNRGNVVVPFEFDFVTLKEGGGFSEGLAWVYKNPKWGIIKNPLLKKDVTQRPDTQAPTITITYPKNAQERGVGKAISTSPTLNVQGQIKDNDKVTAAWLNGQVLALQTDGSFSQSLPLNIGTNSFFVEATDAAQNKASFRFEVERRAETTVSTAFGTYHALLIAAKDYKDPSINDLTFPVSDAQKLKEVLQNKYAFAPQNVKLLSNPTRAQLLSVLQQYSEQLTDKDNLLVFYAGHGEWDAKLRQGYWLLADANANERGNWFSNADLKTYLGGISTKHTLLISDACFSGSIFQGRSNAPNRAVTALANTPSRRAMTSGTLKTVPDESVFMRYLLKRLTENSETYLSAQSLFSSFKEAVINNLPAGSNLIPQYGIVQEAGDEGGDFVFVKK